MKYSFALLLSLILINASYSQTKEEALRDAKITAQATLDMDFKTVLKHTYPPILKLMGGEEAATDFIKQTFENMESQGFVFEKADVQEVSEVIKEHGQYRCYSHSINVMKMGDQRITSKSYLLGIYDEDKKIWYFLEAEKLKNKALADQILPDFKTSLNIPKDDMTFEDIKD